MIPDMLKNAPMFKRLEARIKVLDFGSPVILIVSDDKSLFTHGIIAFCRARVQLLE